MVKADSKLQKNTFYEYHRNASRHSRQVMNAIARLSYLTDKPCHSTSRIYKQYSNMEEKGLSYRRISDILSELTQGGILYSNTRSNGREGYGTQYELRIPPEMILKIYKKSFEKLQEDKKRHLKVKESPEWWTGDTSLKTWDKYYEKVSWREYVDFEEQSLGS